MLPSLTDTLHIYLHSSYMVFVHKAGIFRSKVIAHEQVVVMPGDGPAWFAMIQTLNQFLEQPAWQFARVKVFLSGDFVKYRLVEWHAQINLEEQQTLLLHRFQDIYGEMAKTWSIFISNTGFKQNELACGIERPLMEALEAVLTKFFKSRWIIQPFAIAVINVWRKKIKGKKAWVALLEGDFIHFIGLRDGTWQSFHTRNSGSPVTELDVLFRRELLQTQALSIPDKLYLLPFDDVRFLPESFFCPVEILRHSHIGISADKAILIAHL